MPKIQSPIETGTVVIDQFRIWNLFPDGIDQLGHFGNMRIGSFNPEQIGTIFQTGDTVQDSSVKTSVWLEFVQAIGQSFW